MKVRPSFVGPFRFGSIFPLLAEAFMGSVGETPYAMLTPSGFSHEIVTSGSAMAIGESEIAKMAQRAKGLKSIANLHAPSLKVSTIRCRRGGHQQRGCCLSDWRAMLNVFV
jgi:hypothetical protein